MDKISGVISDKTVRLSGKLKAATSKYENDYSKLINKPSINGAELDGDVSWEDLGVDFSIYATVEDVEAKFTGYDADIKKYISDNHYNKVETVEKIAEEIDTYDDIVKSYLTEYLKTADFNTAMVNYSTTAEINGKLESYVLSADLVETLKNYALKGDIPTDFYTKSESDGKFALKGDIPTDFYTKSESDGKFAFKGDIPTDFYSTAEADEKFADKETTERRITQVSNVADSVGKRLDTDYYTKIEENSYRQALGMQIAGISDSIPTSLSELSSDPTHRVVTDEQISKWNEGGGSGGGDYIAENLLPFPYASQSNTGSNVRYTVNSDGSVTVATEGTAAAARSFYYWGTSSAGGILLKNGKTYTASGMIKGGSNSTYTHRIGLFVDGALTETYNDDGDGVSFTTPESGEVKIFMRISVARNSALNAVIYPMLEEGSTAHAYQPYKLSRQSLRNDIDKCADTLIVQDMTAGTVDDTALEFSADDFTFFKMFRSYTVSGVRRTSNTLIDVAWWKNQASWKPFQDGQQQMYVKYENGKFYAKMYSYAETITVWGVK